jgi:hypothetical protein
VPFLKICNRKAFRQRRRLRAFEAPVMWVWSIGRIRRNIQTLKVRQPLANDQADAELRPHVLHFLATTG